MLNIPNQLLPIKSYTVLFDIELQVKYLLFK